jgi:heme-degrading monooxygenase HmoA
MIARIWHGLVQSDKSDEYFEYLKQTGIPDYSTTAGNRRVKLLCRTEGELTHFLLISYWESLEAIAAFAGPDIEKARYYREDHEYLLDLEPEVSHYEVLE